MIGPFFPGVGRLFQIVYISKARVRFSEPELLALCEKASSQNRKLGVTGLLLYDGTRFIQALEGEEHCVREIMNNVLADYRHTAIDYVNVGEVYERQFGDWSMDHRSAPAGCCSREFLDKVKEDVEAVPDHALRALFIGFAALGQSRPPGYLCAAS